MFSAELYVKIMKKIKERGPDYVQTETDRIGRILGKYGNVSSQVPSHKHSLSLLCFCGINQREVLVPRNLMIL